jgi:hypothetical protein
MLPGDHARAAEGVLAVAELEVGKRNQVSEKEPP